MRIVNMPLGIGFNKVKTVNLVKVPIPSNSKDSTHSIRSIPMPENSKTSTYNKIIIPIPENQTNYKE